MILRIEKPETCMDCVFGEECGFCCSLLDGEQCYELHSDYDRPAWCPFDNGGRTITAYGASVVQECSVSIIDLLKEQEEQKRKWLRSIADNQLANAPSDMMDEKTKEHFSGVWCGLEIAYGILTEES